MVKNRSFRKDLYYRLSIIHLHIPPLRERRDDIAVLVEHYLDFFNQYYQTTNSIGKEALHSLQSYDWPGNVRELKNMLERFVIVNPNAEISISDIDAEIHFQDLVPDYAEIKITEGGGSLKARLQQYEKELIKSALASHKTLAEAAKELKIDVSTLTRKKQKFALNGTRRPCLPDESDPNNMNI